MRTVANRFTSNMDSILGFLDVVMSAVQLAKEDPGRRRSRKPYQIAAHQLHQGVTTCTSFTLVAFDGAFLTACAEYEFTIRDLIGSYIQRATSKCPKFNHLPRAIRDWYPEGCAKIILNITSEKFQHLTRDGVVLSLADCARNRSARIMGEAFSDSDRNFWPQEVDECFQRLGFEKIWQKVSRDPSFQLSVGTSNPETAEHVARMKLTNALTKRNNIIHRGRTYYTPSDSEVRDCVIFLRALIVGLAEVMENSIAAM